MIQSCRLKLVRLVPHNQSCKLSHRSSKSTLPTEFSSLLQRGGVDPRSRRVVITGGGIISPLGHCIHDVFDRTLQGILRQKSGFIQKFTYFYKIHLPEISTFTKFTFLKSQFLQNSPF